MKKSKSIKLVAGVLLGLSVANLATAEIINPRNNQHCRLAAIAAASALSEVNSFAWEMDLHGTRDMVETNFPFMGRVETLPAVRLAQLDNGGVRWQVSVHAWSESGNLITDVNVTVDEYLRADRRQLCSVHQVTSNR